VLIKQWLEKHFVHVKFNAPLAKAIRAYKLSYLTASSDHIEFYGDGLIGVNNVWFKTSFENRLFNSILSIDRHSLLEDLKDVDDDGASKLVPAIVPSRKVSGDIYNIVLLYMVYRFKTSSLSDKLKDAVVRDLLELYCYRTLSAIHSNSFRYLGRLEIARATYNQLNNKFILKRLKTWGAYVQYRVDIMLQNSKNRRDILNHLNNDNDALFIIINASNAIRSTFKVMYQLYLDIKDSGDYAATNTLLATLDDEKVITDVINLDTTVNQLSLAFAGQSIANTAITDVVVATVPRVKPQHVNKLINELSNNYLTYKELLTTLLVNIISYTYNHIQKLDTSTTSDVSALLKSISNVFWSTRSSHPTLLAVRKDGLELIDKAMPSIGEQAKIKLRSALIIYIIVWLLAKR